MNRVVHFEIPATDYEALKEFYSKIFGWEITEYSGGEQKYGMAITTSLGNDGHPDKPGGINGAIMETLETDSSTIVTIEVESIDDYLEKITRLGGLVEMPKTPVGDSGFMARFRDPDGNLVGLWQNL